MTTQYKTANISITLEDYIIPFLINSPSLLQPLFSDLLDVFLTLLFIEMKSYMPGLLLFDAILRFIHMVVYIRHLFYFMAE